MIINKARDEHSTIFMVTELLLEGRTVQIRGEIIL